VFSLLSDTTGKCNTSVSAGTLVVTPGTVNNCQQTNQTKEVIVLKFRVNCLLRWVKVLSIIRVISVIRS
jgi:hypothetical protein